MFTTSPYLTFQQKILFLRRHARRVVRWPVACSILTVGVWIWVALVTQDEKAEIRGRAFNAAAMRAQTYADQLERTIAHLDYIMLSLQYHWQKTGGSLNLEEQMTAGLVPKATEIAITVFDRKGLLVTTTSPEIKSNKSIAFRDYFRIHEVNPDKGIVISKPIRSILIGRDVLILSRRLNTPNGNFAGIIVIAIEPAFLVSFIDETKFGKDDFVSLRSPAGDLLAAKTKGGFQSHRSNFIGNPAVETSSGVRYRPANQYLDAKSRIVGWHSTPHYPIMSVVGIAEATLAAEYAPRYREIQLIAICSTLVLLAVAAALTRRSIARAWKAQYAREVHEAYRIATENAKEGFYMLRALYGPTREIIDFLVEDCNERGAMYRGLPRESLIGKTLSSLLPVLFRSHMLLPCRQAMEKGFFEDEMQVPQYGSRATQWLQRRLVRTSAGLAMTLQDVTESKSHQEQLEQLANADEVTTLPNRHWLMNYLPTAIENTQSMGKILAVLFVDLDDFKNVNDTLGHAAGDELLKAVAMRLKAVIRPDDKVARLGGDEFTILVEAAQTREEVAAVAERVIETLHSPFVLGEGERQHAVRASVGVSVFPQDGADAATLLKHADIAMYAVKTSAKGTYRFFEQSLERRLVHRLTREAELKAAIENKELILYYQPRVMGNTGAIIGMEALVRWPHPTLGLVQPNEFIPMAEKTGLIVSLGAEVIRMACEQLALWKALKLPVVPISVNVSAQQIDTGTVSTVLAYTLQAYALDPSLLEVEVTESAMIAEDGMAAVELAAIQKTGMKVYLDDFGTGFSCLAQLKQLDIDGLKIDRAFTSQLLNSSDDAALFEAIVSMAHALRMRVVAEGVETAEQLAALQKFSCDEVQGYYISRPLPAVDAVMLLKKQVQLPIVD